MPTLPLIQVNFRGVSFGGEDKNGLRNGEHEALIREIVCVLEYAELGEQQCCF